MVEAIVGVGSRIIVMTKEALKRGRELLMDRASDNTHFHHQPRYKVCRTRDNTHSCLTLLCTFDSVDGRRRYQRDIFG